MTSSRQTTGQADRNGAAVLTLIRDLHAALRKGERATIADLLGELVALPAPMGDQWVQLSVIAANNGEVALARRAIDLYLEHAKADPGAPLKKVALLSLIGAWDEALALMRSSPEHLPDRASYAYARGTAALYLGETEEARAWLERAIRHRPELGQAWLALATLVDLALDAQVAEWIVAAERGMAGAPLAERAHYLYALGKTRADRGQHALAFDAFSQGAGLMKSLQPYDREHDLRQAHEALDGWDARRIADMARKQSEATGRTIFVHGLPRSGTTLVQQILLSHSDVANGGEIERLGLLARDVGGLSAAALEDRVEKTGTTTLARLWGRWIDERFPQPGRVVDKSFTTSRHLGMAAALLPEAPLIWLTRNPLDCAWSCFRHRFTGGASWSHDLEDIAFHFRLEDELLTRWRNILGERLLVVPYEGLVDAPDEWIRRILAHCGLAEEPAPFAPHEAKRAVATSSVMQVRKPINRMGLGVAEPYRAFLEPFLAAYSG